MKRVLIFGTFDHLHPGHRYVIQEALKHGDVWAVVARDTTVERIKGHLPSQNQYERIQALEEAFSDVHCILGDDTDYTVPIRTANPDLIVLGYDQKFPPGVLEEDFPCPTVRLDAFEPETYKSSKMKM